MPDTLPPEILLPARRPANKLTRASRMEHSQRNIRQDLIDIGGRIASSDDIHALRDDLSKFRAEFSSERLAAVEIRTRVEHVDGPRGAVARVEGQVRDLTSAVEDLKNTVVRSIGWATGALVVSAFLVGLYERMRH